MRAFGLRLLPLLILSGIMGFYLLYAAHFIHNTSFEIEGTRYYSLFDDAMISMRYARNLVQSHELAWNPGGDRVEGFTNPLWVLIMAVVHLLPVPPERTSLYVQDLGAILLVLNVAVIWDVTGRLARSLGRGALFAQIVAALFCAFSLPLNTWTLQGTEVGLLALMVSVAFRQMVITFEQERFSPLVYLILGVATLVRIDMTVTYGASLFFLWLSMPTLRAQHLRVGLSIFGVFILPQTLFRLLYFGDWLPNTYYLKVEGYPFWGRISRGGEVALMFLGNIGVLPFVGLFLRRTRPLLLVGWLCLTQMLYTIYVGGDAWEWWGNVNRYLSVVLPLFFVLLGITLSLLVEAAEQGWQRLNLPLSPFRAWSYRALGAAVVILLALIHFITFNAQRTPVEGYLIHDEWLLRGGSLNVNWNPLMVQTALLTRSFTSPQARLGVTWAGIIPYFADRPGVDILGKNDRLIAHLPMHQHSQWDRFYPGHLKWDYGYSIGGLRPDVVVQLWAEPESAQPYLVGYQPLSTPIGTIYLRRDSPYILWDKVPGGAISSK
ncbi:MAG: hypothetical protein IAE83_16885 [Anaerolinea sp.]|nr:hypothetical protein [Anaerolinea sp.]